MKPATFDEYFALVVATLVLLVVLISSFMCIQLYRLRKPAPPCDDSACRRKVFGLRPPQGESFLGTFDYAPSRVDCQPRFGAACGFASGPRGLGCAGGCLGGCRGLTTGAMPSIEVTSCDARGDGLCPGLLGVPP